MSTPINKMSSRAKKELAVKERERSNHQRETHLQEHQARLRAFSVDDTDDTLTPSSSSQPVPINKMTGRAFSRAYREFAADERGRFDHQAERHLQEHLARLHALGFGDTDDTTTPASTPSSTVKNKKPLPPSSDDSLRSRISKRKEWADARQRSRLQAIAAASAQGTSNRATLPLPDSTASIEEKAAYLLVSGKDPKCSLNVIVYSCNHTTPHLLTPYTHLPSCSGHSLPTNPISCLGLTEVATHTSMKCAQCYQSTPTSTPTPNSNSNSTEPETPRTLRLRELFQKGELAEVKKKNSLEIQERLKRAQVLGKLQREREEEMMKWRVSRVPASISSIEPAARGGNVTNASATLPIRPSATFSARPKSTSSTAKKDPSYYSVEGLMSRVMTPAAGTTAITLPDRTVTITLMPKEEKESVEMSEAAKGEKESDWEDIGEDQDEWVVV